ncbi:MAG: hypothetical protein ACYTFK_11940 [Planctomycetota bacterium]|jgi:hypothetical protein
MTTETKLAELQKIGECAYDSIACMVDALECDYDRLEDLRDRVNSDDQDDALDDDELVELAELEDQANGNDCVEDAEQCIDEDPLSLQVRSDWHCPGADSDCAEFELLLGTGGPAVRIRGGLNSYGEPDSAVLQVQDWFTPWTDYNGADESVLLEYCARFYFGD